MIRKALSILCFIFLFTASSFAQFYTTQHRPPNQNWQQLNTPHFEFIYAQKNESQAFELAQILETQYPKVQDIVGGELNNFPIILNNYNDRSNGFVTPYNFRSEIELPPIKGKSLNPQTGNWLANVGPHELVHALQFNNLGDYNIPRFVSLFSPDLARMFHAAIPMGMLEGIAVYHETEQITKDGGRGNYPVFTNQFDATFKSGQRWSMGQLMQTSSYTRPFGRHYIGGYEFTDWLHTKFGDKITRETLDFYMDFPFLGYGVALRHTTGLWPGQLYNRFEYYHKGRLSENENSSHFLELDLPYEGPEIRRPKWLSDSKLIFYGSFYNARSGFYTYDLTNKKMRRLVTTNSVSDFRYDLSSDRSQMIFSYYETNPLYDNTSKTELVQYHFDTHQKKQLTKNGRLYDPTFYENELLALKSHPSRSKLVALDNSDYSNEQEVFSASDHEIKAVTVHPKHEQLAVVSNKNGQQALWVTERNDVTEQLKGKPDVAFEEGSVFDPEWHPEDDKILFSADFSGTMQLYEYDLSEQNILQVTNSKFNAFEGSYSPDGNRIAFVRQEENKRLPGVLERTSFSNNPVSKTVWKNPLPKGAIGEDIISDSVAQASKNWQTDSYSSGLGWLKPRTILPFAEEVSNNNGYQAGISLHSVNTLSTQAYSADISYFKERGWYDIAYQNKTFWPGFKLRAFNEPSYRSASGIGVLSRQERSLSLSVPMRIDLNQNIYSTSLFVEPEIRRSQIRFFDAGFNNSISEFANITIGNIYTQINYRLQQNIRDMQPNTGIVLFSELEHHLSGDEVTFEYSNNEITFSSPDATALQAGIYGFLAPLKRWNQSLRIGVRGLTQSGLLFDNQSIVSDGFSDLVFPGSHNLLSLNTRYTIPITYVDNGGLLLPLYLSNIYLVAFSNTVTDPTFSNWYRSSRTVFGIGVRTNFQISNLRFNIGFGFGYEPTRNQTQFFIGDF
ncbi:TolB family protein [Fodinibius sp. AD559]|uniref:TolB family protein n=1 Tax=Fodinibius sp. AD559 TaxID=3424179 RepID=UPI004046BB97